MTKPLPKSALAALLRRQPKYRNTKTTLDGVTFDSKAEATRYAALKIMQRAGMIADLRLQPSYPLVVNGVKVAEYRADFAYLDASGALVVEDVKSQPTRTAVYMLKKKLMLACHGVTIREVMGR